MPAEQTNKGSFIFRAAYQDKGTKLAPAQGGESVVVLRNPTVLVNDVSKVSEISYNGDKTVAIAKGKGAYLQLSNVDLSDIKNIEFAGTGNNAIGNIEVRLGSPDGTLIGKADGSAANSKATAAITATKGKHNVYFVFGDADARLKAITMMNR